MSSERQYTINPKITYQEVQAINTRAEISERAFQVGAAMLQNAHELFGWSSQQTDVVQNTYSHGNDQHETIDDIWGLTMAAIAVGMSWNLDQPEMVYMSGKYMHG